MSVPTTQDEPYNEMYMYGLFKQMRLRAMEKID